jgi:hypothetical protein
MDPDALLYIAKIERADNAALESGVKEAINNFVVACKDTKIWDKITFISIMAGARSLTGAITCLKGPSNRLNNYNFTLSDYSRKNGFTGDGTSKYFDSGIYYASSEALNDYHVAVNLTSLDTIGTVSPVWGHGGSIYDSAGTHNTRVRSRNTGDINVGSWATGVSILSRDNSSNFNWRNNKTTTNYTQASVTTNGASAWRILRSASTFSTNVINYFSGGKAITELPTYDNIISTLLRDIGRAVN